MNEIRKIPLGDIATLQAGVGFPIDLQGRRTGEYPLAKVGDISRGGRSGQAVLSSADHYIDKVDLERLRAKPIPKGSILFAKIGEAISHNHRVIAGCDMLIDNNAMAAIPGPDVLGRYLYHYLRTVDFYRLASATTVPALRKTELEKVTVPLPTMSEQRQIAEMLDMAEDLRSRRRVCLAQIGSLIRAMFLDLFGDPTSNPKGFHKVRLGELIKLKSGEFLPATGMAPGGTFPVFGGNGVNGYHDQFLFDEPRIIIGRVGVYCGCVHVSPAKSWVTDNALYVSERNPAVEFDYLAYALTSANLNQYASQSGQPLLSGSRIYPVEILAPPLGLQREFSNSMAVVEKLKGFYCASLQTIDELLASIQYRAFRGEL